MEPPPIRSSLSSSGELVICGCGHQMVIYIKAHQLRKEVETGVEARLSLLVNLHP